MSWVVDTPAQAADLALPPLLVREPLQRLLDAHGLGSGPIEARLVGDGQSNVTIRIERGTESFVLRRPPRPPFQPTAHDVLREARIQKALQGTAVPVPEIVLVHPDTELLGVPFYLMRWLDGDVLTTTLPTRFTGPGDVRSIVESMAATLADLHAVDFDAVGLGDLGKRTGFAARQMMRWNTVWQTTRGRDIPDVEWVGRWLTDNVPQGNDTRLIHNDYRIGNIMLAPDDQPRIRAVLDWEIATLGDPLIDLAWTLTTYPQAGDAAGTLLSLASSLVVPNAPTRAGLAELYEKSSGHKLPEMRWYLAFSFWRAAVGLESLYVRRATSRDGASAFQDGLETGVPELAARARAEIAKNDLAD
jgi:aminoglycoside phosphotransferase (APT) family kinase protein